MWVDSRSINKASAVETAVGTKNIRQVHDHYDNLWWDISAGRENVKNTSIWMGGIERWKEGNSSLLDEKFGLPLPK